MINDETKRKLRELKLNEIIAILELQQADKNTIILSFNERIQQIVDYLYQEKYNNRIKMLMRMANFRLPKADINCIYYEERGINKNTITELSTCQFVDNHINIIFQGFTGSGKTYLACAIGRAACKLQIKTRYIRLPDLLMEYQESQLLPKGKAKFLKKYEGCNVLIIDEWLLEDMTDDEQRFILELIERRYDSSSTIFCTQYKKDEWHSRLGGGIRADAIMDRIVHNATWIETGKLNMREYCAKNSLND